jgi:hypothetical protein
LHSLYRKIDPTLPIAPKLPLSWLTSVIA